MLTRVQTQNRRFFLVVAVAGVLLALAAAGAYRTLSGDEGTDQPGIAGPSLGMPVPGSTGPDVVVVH